MRPQTNFVVHLVRLVTFKPLDIADTAAANTTELSPTASRVRTRSSLRIAHRTSTATQSKGDSAKQTTRTTIIPPPLILINGHRPSYYTQQVLTEPLLTTKLPTLGQSFVSQPSSSSTNMSQNDYILPKPLVTPTAFETTTRAVDDPANEMTFDALSASSAFSSANFLQALTTLTTGIIT